MYPKNIAVIYNILEEGTQKLERDQEIAILADALLEGGHQVSKIGINGDIKDFFNTLTTEKPDYVFNMCEDVDNDNWGEIYIAGILELLNIPYTGSDPLCLGICLDKGKSKDILNSYRIPTPRHQIFTKITDQLNQELQFPFIVKPIYEDGSYGIETQSVVNNEEELKHRLGIILNEYSQPALVEEYIAGREINVSVVGNGDNIRILPFSEIDYSSLPEGLPKICSYSAKWEQDSEEYKGTMPVCPALVNKTTGDQLEEISKKVYEIFGCCDYARVDFRVTEDGQPYVIDVNPNPCISPDSGFARSGAAAGLEYKDLMRTIFDICKERSNGNDSDQQSTNKDISVIS